MQQYVDAYRNNPEFRQKTDEAMQGLMARSTTDADFRQLLLSDSRTALSQHFGRDVPEAGRIVFVENKADATVVLPNVIDPNGELVEVGRVTQSGLTKQRDCPGRSNACQGQNMENVYLEDGEPLAGAYSVSVRLEQLGKREPPVLVMLGARVGQKTYSLEFDLKRPEDEQQVTLEF